MTSRRAGKAPAHTRGQEGRIHARGARGLRAHRLPLLLVPLIALIAYLPTLTHEFVWDDVTFIEQNAAAHGLGRTGQAMSHGYGWVPDTAERIDDSLYFRPIVTLANLLHWSLAGGHAWFFHLANAITHALCALLLAAIVLAAGLSPGAALFAGGLMAVHPLASEAVAWISGRTDLSAALFSLALLLILIRWRKGAFGAGGRVALAAPLAAGLALFCALGSKESAAGVLPIALLIVWHPLFAREDHAGAGESRTAAGEAQPRMGRRHAARGTMVAALLAAAAIYAALRLSALGYASPGAGDPLGALPDRGPLDARLLLGGNLLLHYLQRLVIPHPLTIEPPPSLQASPYPVLPGVLGQLLLLAAGVMLVWWIARTRRAAAILGLGLFLATLLPVLQWLPTPEVYGERFVYLPLAGLLLLTAALIDSRLSLRRGQAVILTLALGIPAAVLLQARLPAWHDEIALFQSAVASRPASARAERNLGSAFMRRGALAEAEPHLARALSLDPDDPLLHAKYGSILVTRGDADKGVQHLLQAYEAGERSKPTLRNLAVGLSRQGRVEEAGRVFEEALVLDPRDADLLEGLGTSRRMVGRFDEAERIYRRVIDLDPTRPTVYLSLFGMHYFERRDAAAARPWGEAFLSRFPGSPQAAEIRGLLERDPAGDAP